MEDKLFKAACTGDLKALDYSVREDGAILQKLHSRRCPYTPLHLASMYGRADFVREYIIRGSISTQQLCQLNQDGYSPMHLASTNGHTEVVRILLEFGHKNSVVESLCLTKDKDEGTALHSAVATGNLGVIEMLFAACPQAAKVVTADEESVLHIAVKHHQFEALKLLIEKLGSEKESLLNLRDPGGKTVLGLATVRRQHQIVKYLGKLPGVDVNAESSNGLALDTECVSNSNRTYVNQEETELTGGTPQTAIINITEAMDNVSNQNELSNNHNIPRSDNVSNQNQLNNNPNIPRSPSRQDKSLIKDSDVKNGIIVMASIVITLTFQVALTPPGGVWQDSGPNAGKSILYDSNHWKYGVVLFCNMNAFILSVFIILIALHPSKLGFGPDNGVALTYAVDFTMGLLLAEFFSILFLTMDKMYQQAAFIVTAVFWCTFIAFLSLLFFSLWRLMRHALQHIMHG